MLARARWVEQDSCRELKIKTGKQLEKTKWVGKHLPSQSASLREDFARLEIEREDREAEWAIRPVDPGNVLRLDQPSILAPIALLMGNRIEDVPCFTRNWKAREIESMRLRNGAATSTPLRVPPEDAPRVTGSLRIGARPSIYPWSGLTLDLAEPRLWRPRPNLGRALSPVIHGDGVVVTPNLEKTMGQTDQLQLG
jgi:hypothetical protein